MRQVRETSSWGQQSPTPGSLPGEMETAVPARPANLVADVLVPGAQAAITGALLGGLFVFLLAEVAPDFDGDLLKLWAITALAIAAVAWLVLLGQTRRLLWAIERWTGQDLDGDGLTGQPAPAVQERVVIVNAGQAQQEAAQRETHERASQFADFVARLPTRGTAVRAWKELDRETYNDYRDALIRLGWARWKSTKPDGTPTGKARTQGWELVLPADQILQRISG